MSEVTVEKGIEAALYSPFHLFLLVAGCKYLASIDSPQESAINAAEFDKQTGVGKSLSSMSHLQSPR